MPTRRRWLTVQMTDRPTTDTSGHEAFNVDVLWERMGITEHLGGVEATRRLLGQCCIARGQQVLEIGCGTGYTACLLAREYGAQVTATDISRNVLMWAAQRVRKAHVGDGVTLRVADAQSLPFPDASFDAVIAESALVFCDADYAAREAWRVLRPGGVFGLNELTFLKPPPPQLRAILASAFGQAIRLRLASEWTELLRGAGFSPVSTQTYRISILQQARSHLRVDGLRHYLAAFWSGVSDPLVRSVFFTQEMLRAWRDFLPYVGYGLYVGRKA